MEKKNGAINQVFMKASNGCLSLYFSGCVWLWRCIDVCSTVRYVPTLCRQAYITVWHSIIQFYSQSTHTHNRTLFIHIHNLNFMRPSTTHIRKYSTYILLTCQYHHQQITIFFLAAAATVTVVHVDGGGGFSFSICFTFSPWTNLF